MIPSKDEKLVEEVLREERVRFLSRSDPVTASPSTPMAEVVQLLRKESAVVVVEPVSVASGEKGTAKGAAKIAVETEGERAQRGGPESTGSRPRPIGIFTERDYLDKLVSLAPDEWLNVKYNAVEQHMTKNLRSLSADERLDRAIQLMTERGYRHLPIVDEAGGLVGVISARDIIGCLAEYFPMEIYNLPPSLDQDQVFDTREGG